VNTDWPAPMATDRTAGGSGGATGRSGRPGIRARMGQGIDPVCRFVLELLLLQQRQPLPSSPPPPSPHPAAAPSSCRRRRRHVSDGPGCPVPPRRRVKAPPNRGGSSEIIRAPSVPSPVSAFAPAAAAECGLDRAVIGIFGILGNHDRRRHDAATCKGAKRERAAHVRTKRRYCHGCCLTMGD
jgi:hypothetical protein